MDRANIVNLIEPLAEPLAQVERLLIREASSSGFPHINRAAQHIMLDQGKRLRPVLVLASAKAFGPISHDHVLFAVITELLHTATLLHDDVLDEADIRRHRRSVNAEWGNSTSVLLGDYLFARAFILLSSLGSQDLFSLVSQTTRDICEGELLQISTARSAGLSEADYFRMIKKKTASLFAACCQGSAMISGAGEALIERLRLYGEILGQAFQVGDDILDLVGNSDVEGKTLGTDLKKGKMTLPLIHLVSHLDEHERESLEDMITQRMSHVSDAEIQGLMAKGQGLPETLTMMEDLCHQAIFQIESFPPEFDLSLFRMIPDYILQQARRHLSESADLLKVS